MTNPPKLPPRGLRGDIQRAREGASASAEELREFVNQLSGRSPQEALGVIAASDLVRATVLATVITVVGIAAFTVGPYFWNKAQSPKESPVAAPAAAPASTAKPAPTTVAGPAGSLPPGGLPPAGLPPAGSAPADPLSRLGVNETKPADPKSNPLENSKDDLLKDIGK
jgi:hypothetical protein